MVERELHAYTFVDAAFDDVTELLGLDAAGVLASATDSAAAEATRVGSRLTVEVGGVEVGQDIEIEVGEFEPLEMLRVRLPLRWHASEHASLFPSMEAWLEVRALSIDTPHTQLVLVGTYKPPLGAVGAALDSAVGHHVAQAAIRRFVDDVAVRVSELAPTLH